MVTKDQWRGGLAGEGRFQTESGRRTPDSPTDHLGERERDGDREGGGIKLDVLRGNTMVDMRQEQEDQVVLVILQNLSLPGDIAGFLLNCLIHPL